MHPVVAPSRSSHTRSVLARFLARFSGYGIFTDVTRLMALRTSSRSAAVEETAGTQASRLARKTDLAGWNIWKNPPVETRARGRTGGLFPRSKQSPRFNSRHSPRFAKPNTKTQDVVCLPQRG